MSAPVTDKQDILGMGTKALQLVFETRPEVVHMAWECFEGMLGLPVVAFVCVWDLP